jgi:16S rRNA (guanine1516-N2)-methyltransferase
VIDCTAGWGRDAVSLAAAGCGVKLVERHPVVSALLQVLLMHAQMFPPVQEPSLVRRLQVNAGTADGMLETVTEADVLYADPLFPAKGRTSLASGHIELLRTLTGDDMEPEPFAAALLEHASRLKARLVMKRSRRGKLSDEALRSPDYTVNQNAVAFDVWLPR